MMRVTFYVACALATANALQLEEAGGQSLPMQSAAASHPTQLAQTLTADADYQPLLLAQTSMPLD